MHRQRAAWITLASEGTYEESINTGNSCTRGDEENEQHPLLRKTVLKSTRGNSSSEARLGINQPATHTSVASPAATGWQATPSVPSGTTQTGCLNQNMLGLEKHLSSEVTSGVNTHVSGCAFEWGIKFSCLELLYPSLVLQSVASCLWGREEGEEGRESTFQQLYGERDTLEFLLWFLLCIYLFLAALCLPYGARFLLVVASLVMQYEL